MGEVLAAGQHAVNKSTGTGSCSHWHSTGLRYIGNRCSKQTCVHTTATAGTSASAWSLERNAEPASGSMGRNNASGTSG